MKANFPDSLQHMQERTCFQGNRDLSHVQHVVRDGERLERQSLPSYMAAAALPPAQASTEHPQHTPRHPRWAHQVGEEGWCSCRF